MIEYYRPTDTEIMMDLLIEEGRLDETGGTVGERDMDSILSTCPPEDPIARECEDMG